MPHEYTPEAVFASARTFYCAYRELAVRHFRSEAEWTWLAVPCLVNGALALELYLKCLRVLEGKGVKKGHEVSKLFSGLTPETQQRVTSAWRERFHRNDRVAPADFRASIEPLDDVFVAWRYVFESPSIVTDTRPLDAALTSVQQALLELKPEWFPQGAVIQTVVSSDLHTIIKLT